MSKYNFFAQPYVCVKLPLFVKVLSLNFYFIEEILQIRNNLSAESFRSLNLLVVMI